jgi:dissimilatory sulfite reductase (desulfoviridin) alpha/beta subunit
LVTKLGYEKDIAAVIAKKGFNKFKTSVESIGDNNMQEQFTERCHPS